MKSTSPQSEDVSIPDLRSQLTGEVIGPGDPGYEEARGVFVKGIDCRPAAIAQVADAGDVARVISLARETGIELAVRSGGHSGAGFGTSDGGIVLDLSRMQALEIDVEGRTAWAETGLTAGQYTVATGEHGLATGFGDAGAVGIGGITLGGGVGFLVRKNGMTIDDLLGAEVVTADGRRLHVDEENEPDLFWAIRGGGGNFGVATRLRFRLHEVGEIVGGMLMLPATPDVLASFIAEADAAPEELSAIVNVVLAPPMPFVPEVHHGKPIVMAQMAYAGGDSDGERAIAPFRALAEPVADMLRPIRYPQMYEGPGADGPSAVSFRNLLVDAIDAEAAATIVENIAAAKAPRPVTQIRVLGGAMARVPSDATAFAHRDRRIMANVVAVYDDPAEAPVHDEWATGLADAIDDGKPAAYVGFLDDVDEATLRRAYPGATWDRLAEVKRRYDPDNLFRLNHNIPPAAE
jgi:FAD/FMN-containing dehydrogenase